MVPAQETNEIIPCGGQKCSARSGSPGSAARIVDVGCATDKQLLEHLGWAGRSWMPAMRAERTGSKFDSGLLKLWMVRGP